MSTPDSAVPRFDDFRAPLVGTLRRMAAATLRAASTLLARWAARLVTAAPQSGSAPVLEFYAEAGAPEGALYLDGELVGHLPGVARL